MFKKLSVTKSAAMIKLMMGILLIPFLALAVPETSDTIEALYDEASRALEAFESDLTLRERRDMNHTAWKDRMALPPSLRKKYLRWNQLLDDEERWGKAGLLKQELLALYPDVSQRSAGVVSDADRISREVIQIMYKYRKEWDMFNMALFQNILINMKIKKKGFCWHWVEKFIGTLRPLHLRHYDFHWGVAYEGKIRENNALVITRQGGTFESGLAVDAWRSSGRPFWRLVKKDRFPWVKRDESLIEIGEYDEVAESSSL
jgi:hypothetical protein